MISRHVSNGYPATRIYRLLRAADEPVTALTPAELAVENRQPQLSEQPFSVTLQQLALRVPALRDFRDTLEAWSAFHSMGIANRALTDR